MRLFNNEKGFAFLSLFLSLFTAIIALPLLLNLLQATNLPDLYEQHSVNTFFHLINNELFFVKEYQVRPNSLILKFYNDEVITISKYRDLIRRQVNGLGHEIYLRDIKEFIIEDQLNGFKITIEMLTGDIFEKRFSFYNF